jgi:hypothetical protein
LREPEALIKSFDGEDSDIVTDGALSPSIPETNIAEEFRLPTRNWNLLIDSYNKSHKKKFEFTPLQCRVILERVKYGIPADTIFQAFGVTKQRYTHFISRFNELEERWAQLASQKSLTDEEFDEVNEIMRHPLRVLLADIDRAKGISDIHDWDRWNQMAEKATDLQTIKMKAKFKEFFSERPSEATGFNVNIQLGGNFIDSM